MKIVYDTSGTPGILAQNVCDAYAGLGMLHARHRGLQATLLHCAARGLLSQTFVALKPLRQLDQLVRRLELMDKARADEHKLERSAGDWLDAYVQTFNETLKIHRPGELRWLGISPPPIDRATILASLMLSAYLGLAEGQERMEIALVEALQAGADVNLLEKMFEPFLLGWDPNRLRRVHFVWSRPLASALSGGSNAWAISAQRSASGAPMLCADPHLQINQLPALFFEVRVCVADDYWLGASIPGLPGMALGRNRHVAWSGTFGCADNVDLVLDHVDRQTRLSARWAGTECVADSLTAHLRLPLARSVAEAQQILRNARTFSLHFVLADRSGTIGSRYCGTIPNREEGESGLYPIDSAKVWKDYLSADSLPEQVGGDFIVSANDPLTTATGKTLTTLAQPTYRRDRILSLLKARPFHDRKSAQQIQFDLVSNQALRLLPKFLPFLQEGLATHRLRLWNGDYGGDEGLHVYFEALYRAAVRGLGESLGGSWFAKKTRDTEILTWWCAAIDRVLFELPTLQATQRKNIQQALAAVHLESVEVLKGRTYTQNHLLFGELGNRFAGLSTRSVLRGSIATVHQGNFVSSAHGTIAVGPAYRMICDLGSDDLWTTIPGGIDGDITSSSYRCWMSDWESGRYHCLRPPETADETINI